MYIDIEELRVEADIAYKLGNYRFASNLMDAIDTIEVYVEPEGFRPPNAAIFNRAKKPLVKESFHSPKITRWTKKNTKHLLDAIGNSEGFEGFRTRSGLTETTDQALRTRMYVIGYHKDSEGEWIKS